jgi:hypothetical protein
MLLDANIQAQKCALSAVTRHQLGLHFFMYIFYLKRNDTVPKREFNDTNPQFLFP